jgi:hypothetical protein
VVNKKHIFTKEEVHNHDARSANNYHQPITNLIKYQKGAPYTGINIFNHLPTHIKCVANEIQGFKSAVNGLLLTHLFYSGIF